MNSSNHTCTYQRFPTPQVAMLFLSKGPLHHEALWRRWFALARDKLPYDGLAAAVCGSPATTDVLLQVRLTNCGRRECLVEFGVHDETHG